MNIVCISCGHVWQEDGCCSHSCGLKAAGRWWRAPEPRSFIRRKPVRKLGWEPLRRRRM